MGDVPGSRYLTLEKRTPEQARADILADRLRAIAARARQVPK